MLEAGLREDNCFATLTYRDAMLPRLDGSDLPSLSPLDVQLWLKRLREAWRYSAGKFGINDAKLRFYLAGEYGDETFRPHYHAAIFGLPTCARGRTLRRPGSTRPEWERCCSICRLVGETWEKGDVDLGVLEVTSAQYVAGYVVKKMTSADDRRLCGRHPEFARMSNRPGVGQSAMWDVASELLRYRLDERLPDVPLALNHGKKQMPLGRYLRRELRKMVGKLEETPIESLEAYKEEMRPVREAAFNASRSYKEVLLEVNKAKRQRSEARAKIFKGRRSL